jgi:hypothetical protein
MQPRRSLRLVAGALVLALPLLSSCGFGKATEKVYTPGQQTNSLDGEVKVLAAVVVAAQPGSGTFLASLSNTSSKDATALTELSGAGGSQDLSIGTIDSPEDIPPRGFVNLADEGGVTVTGDFGAGDVVELTLGFDSGDTVTMQVPVVYACDEYADLDTSTESPSASASPSETPSDSATPSDDATPSDEPSTEVGPPYDCAEQLEED